MKEQKIVEYIYFDENNIPEYSTRFADKYNNNQHMIVLSFENDKDRTIILNNLFPNDQRR